MKDQYIIGRNPVLELLKSGAGIDKLYVQKGDRQGSITKILGKAKDENILVQYVDRNKLTSLADSDGHQGVVALVSGFEYSTLEDMLDLAKDKNEDPFIIILDGIEDPHNLGAIVRSAECAGAHGVIIPKRRAAGVNQTVYKTSAGAVEHMKVSQVTNISNTIDGLKERGLWIYGADGEGDQVYYKNSLLGPIALVVGSEGKGISRLVKEKCDLLVKIPMLGKVSSLNASVATSILIYEVVRQRNEKQK